MNFLTGFEDVDITEINLIHNKTRVNLGTDGNVFSVMAMLGCFKKAGLTTSR